MTTQYRAIPVTDDFDTGGFWQAAQDGRIAVLACRSCGRILHLPRPGCDRCGAVDVVWQDVSPTGTVYSWTVVEHSAHPGFVAPYTIALIQLDDAPEARLLTCIDGRADLQFGTAMVATFDDIRDGVVVPQWVVANQ